MPKCHQQHNIPWASIVALPVLPGKNKEGHFYPMQGLLWPKGWEEKALHFSGCLENTIKDFSKTELAKYKDIQKKVNFKIFADSEIGTYKNSLQRNIFTEDIQNSHQWKKILDNYDRYKNDVQKNIVLSDMVIIVKELFNRGEMSTLFTMAQSIKSLGELSFYQSGLRAIITDALFWYIYSNLKVLSNNFEIPEKWYVYNFLSGHDYDDHKRIYRELLGGYKEEIEVSEDDLLESQKFAFKMLYHFQAFHDELSEDNPLIDKTRTIRDWRGNQREIGWMSIEWEHLIMTSIFMAQQVFRQEALGRKAWYF